jgi:phage-related minor tail protein
MARGWESKSVEQQQAEMAGTSKSAGPRLSPAQQKLNRQREGLLLARTRMAEQLRIATRPERRQMLEQSLAEIDKQLASFEKLAEAQALK